MVSSILTSAICPETWAPTPQGVIERRHARSCDLKLRVCISSLAGTKRSGGRLGHSPPHRKAWRTDALISECSSVWREYSVGDGEVEGSSPSILTVGRRLNSIGVGCTPTDSPGCSSVWSEYSVRIREVRRFKSCRPDNPRSRISGYSRSCACGLRD